MKSPHIISFPARAAFAPLALAASLLTSAMPATADAAGPPFDCATSTIFVSQGFPMTQLSSLEYGSGVSAFIPIGAPVSPDYNGIAFNPADGLIYGIETTGGKRVVKLDSTGTVTPLGVSVPSAFFPNAGAIALGNYYVTSAVSGQGKTLYKIDLLTPAVSTITLSQDAFMNDFSLVGGSFWGLGAVTIEEVVFTQLVRMNPVTGQVDRFAQNVVPTGVDAGAAWTYANGNLGLSDNATGTIYQIRIDNPDSAMPTFTLIATANGPASSRNDGTSCVGDPADLSLFKTAPAAVEVGSPLSFTLQVQNLGPGTSSGYTLVDAVPGSITNVQTSTPGCTVAGNTVSCVGGAILFGETDTIVITGTASQATSVLNTASLLSNDIDPSPGNDSSSTTVAVNKRVSTLTVEPVPAVTVTQGLQIRILISPKATLRDANGNVPIAGKSIVFKAGLTPLCTATTNAQGVATCQASLLRTLAGLLSLGYTGQYAGDTSYNPSQGNGGILGLKLF